MAVKIAKADVTPKRQYSQYSCVTTSLSMALQAVGIPAAECQTERVNAVLGAMPLQGASWEQAAGAASHYGCRTTLVIPSTLAQVRKWTDAGTPVLIGWNTGNEWSHASLVFDVTDTKVFVADPNLPNPDTLVWEGTHDEFYAKWWEKSAQGYKIRRPAMAVEREITTSGRQVMASTQRTTPASRVASAYLNAKSHDVKEKRDPSVVTIKKEDLPKNRLGPEVTTRRPGGPMHNRTDDVESGRSRKPKHKQNWSDKDAENT